MKEKNQVVSNKMLSEEFLSEFDKFRTIQAGYLCFAIFLLK